MGKPLVRFREGQEIQPGYGRDIVAPSRKQVVTEKTNFFLAITEGSCLLERSDRAFSLFLPVSYVWQDILGFESSIVPPVCYFLVSLPLFSKTMYITIANG